MRRATPTLLARYTCAELKRSRGALRAVLGGTVNGNQQRGLRHGHPEAQGGYRRQLFGLGSS